MTALEHILPHALPFLMVLFRLAGLFVVAPVLGGATVPTQMKILLVLGLAIVVYPTIDLHANVPLRLDLLALAPVMASELMIGVVIGTVASLPIMAVQMGGQLMGQQMGLGIANFYNPAIDTEADIIGQILFYMAIGLFLLLGGLELMITAVVGTFARVPIGAFTPGADALEVILGMVVSGFDLAIRVAAPVLCVMFLETVATGFLMKTVPQLNVLSFGFPIKILAGVSTLIAAVAALHTTIGDEVQWSLRQIVRWSTSIEPGVDLRTPEDGGVAPLEGAP